MDLGGNLRRKALNPGKLSNVFGITVGVSINLLTKSSATPKKAGDSPADLHYQLAPDSGKASDKLAWLEEQQEGGEDTRAGTAGLDAYHPDAQHTWLNQGHPLFPQLPALGSPDSKKALKLIPKYHFSPIQQRGKTSRDAWCWNSSLDTLTRNMKSTINFYNEEVDRWIGAASRNALPTKSEAEKASAKSIRPRFADDFVKTDPKKLKWDGQLKKFLIAKKHAEFAENKLRRGLYRPFVKRHLFFDSVMNNCRYRQPYFFPVTDSPNRVICISTG